MPDPRPNESRDAWMARCVPELIGEGKSPAEAQATCQERFRREGGRGPNSPHPPGDGGPPGTTPGGPGSAAG